MSDLNTDKFTAPQKSNAVLWYGICGDYEIVQNKFKAAYGFKNENIEVPSEDQIKKWYNNFRNTGFIDVEDAVLHEEEIGQKTPPLGHHHSKVDQMVSTISNKLSKWFLDGPRIRTFHPYHLELIKFGEADLEDREKFAKAQLEHLHKWSHILKSMWFTGEVKFFTDGRVESNNLIYTSHRKPDESISLPHKITKIYQPSQAPFVTVWAAMNEEIFVGPYFVDGEMTQEAYKQILEKFVHQLRPMTSSIDHPIFIHDDSQVHSSTDIVVYLEKEFPHHWIGSGSTYAYWPHHSPDLSPINFFLWGYIKSRVYKVPINSSNVEELKHRIQIAFKNVSRDLLEEAVEEYKTRLERVVRTSGNLVDATVYGEEIDYSELKTWGVYAWPLI